MKPTRVCRYLRTKSMYIPALGEDPHNAEQIGRSFHCWCNCTLSETGPDDRPVAADVCSPERRCFEE